MTYVLIYFCHRITSEAEAAERQKRSDDLVYAVKMGFIEKVWAPLSSAAAEITDPAINAVYAFDEKHLFSGIREGLQLIGIASQPPPTSALDRRNSKTARAVGWTIVGVGRSSTHQHKRA